MIRRSLSRVDIPMVVDRNIALTNGASQSGTPFIQPAETQNLPRGRQRETLVTTVVAALADDISDIGRFPLTARHIGTDSPADNDYLIQAFNNSPRTGMSAADLRRHLIWQLELTGECYLIDTNETITPLLDANVTILPARPGQTHTDGSPALVAGYLIRDDTGQELGRYDSNGTAISGQAVGTLIRIHHPYPGNPYRADAPVSRAQTSINTLAYARQAAQHALRNSGTPAGLVTITDPGITQESIAEFDRRLNSRLTDITQRGRVLAVGADITYKELDTPDPSTGITALADLATREILRVWAMPPSRLGDASERTYENQRVEMRSYISNTIAPRLNLIASALTQMTRHRGIIVEFDLLAPELGEADEEAASRAALLYESGLLTLEEARELVGFDAPKAEPAEEPPVPKGRPDAQSGT